MADKEQPVRYAVRDRVAWITIDREAKRNAMNDAAIAALHSAFVCADEDHDIRAIVLTGAGNKAFCAGGDLSGGTDIFSRGGAQITLPLANLMRRIDAVQLPIIARVNGACMAGGVALLAMCDLAIAADHARFGLPEARVGIFPMQVLARLKSLLRPRDLAELCLCAEPIDANRAREIGLINAVVPFDQLDAAVDALVGRLLAGAPTAIARGKYALAAMRDLTFEQAVSFAEGQVGLQAATEDAKEGVLAFQQKRAPAWPGR
jgi:enoyl-CoA hydratase/carnithine racemase